MSPNVADLILKQLADYGIKQIYGVVGDAIFPLADAFTRQDRIRFIPTTIETAASFMASASAKLTGLPGVCIGTSGPGAANLANGVADAYMDQAPLLCITGQVPANKLGTKTKQYIDQSCFFNAITSASRLCIHPEAVSPALHELLDIAQTFKTPVHFAVPQDVFSMPVSEESFRSAPSIAKLNPCTTALDNATSSLQFLHGTERPLIIAGKIPRTLCEDLHSFANNYGAGIILGQESKGIIPDMDPLVLGGAGEAYLPDILAEADLILLFGEAVYEDRFIPEKTKVIQFKSDSGTGSLKHAQMVADLHLLLKELNGMFPEPCPRTAWRSRIKKAHDARLETVAQYSAPQHPANFFRKLSELIQDDAIVCLDVGEFAYWFDFAFLAQKQQVLLSTNWRSMGSGIPSGIAACLDFPGRKVVSVIGDGGFLMSMAELSTVLRYNLPLTIFVMRNKVYGLEKQKMSKQGLTCVGTDLTLPDLMKIAAAFNMRSYRITDSTGFHMLKEAIENPPALVELEDFSAMLPSL